MLFCFQSALTQKEYSTELFSVVIPSNWIAMSYETADYLRSELHFTDQFSVRSKYDHLVQRKTNDTLFSYPCFLIQRNNSNRLTKNELKSFDSKLFSLDPGTLYLWGYRDSLIEVIIPTEEGTINVFCNSTSSDIKKNKEEYTRFINSIALNPRLKYRESVMNDIPLLGDLFSGKIFHERIFSFILIGIIIGLIVKSKRQRAEH